MGIGSWLLELGVRAETVAGQVAVRTGAMPLQWPVGSGGLIWRLPTDPHKRASLFSTAQTIVVNEGETAVVLADGQSNGALPPGRYVFEKKRVVGSLDIVWMKTSQQAMKWGVGNVTSADGIQVGATGQMYLAVSDGVQFNSEVVRGATALAEIDLQRLVVPRVQGVLRPVFTMWPAIRLQAEREAFREEVKTKLAEALARLGMTVVDFEVVQVDFPPEFKAMLSAATMNQLAGNATLIEAQARAQSMLIEAQAAAQAKLSIGAAEVHLLTQMQSAGIDPLRMKALEALNTLAANPGPGGSLTGDAARTQIIGQVTAAALAGTPLVSVPPPALLPPPPAIPAAPPAPSAEAPEDLERQLDQLTDRLARGELSEALYNKLAARLEARLKEMRG
ncbi:MAG: SPFH domain-containing protein [Deltaproteobacteria bacterium]|nr:SPFH domain-containing protein [Deltaproteobacteria bacterium]